MLHGQGAVRAGLALQQRGFTPDVICAHPGWGEELFLKDVFPDAKLLTYCEFYYRADGSDVGFDPEQPVSLDTRCRIRAKNAALLISLEAADWGISPTEWQHRQHPDIFRSKISIIHDGVDTDLGRPDETVTIILPDGRPLTRRDEVVTYVARNLEPYRGFPTFMRAAADILRRRPYARILVVGGDEVSYGAGPTDAANWREKMLAEVTPDPDRIHFLGKVPYDQFLRILRLSRAHVYLTYPFVLSWSLLEAMACGAVVVGSATPPVKEVIDHGRNGFLVDLFDSRMVADRVVEALERASDDPDSLMAAGRGETDGCGTLRPEPRLFAGPGRVDHRSARGPTTAHTRH